MSFCLRSSGAVAANTTIFTLPAGYRPSSASIFSISAYSYVGFEGTDNKSILMAVYANGTVKNLQAIPATHDALVFDTSFSMI